MAKKIMVKVIVDDLRPETGILIEKGCRGFLRVINTPNGWPVFTTLDTGTEWDIAVEEDELDDMFKLIEVVDC
jgi:hypothetical protein